MYELKLKNHYRIDASSFSDYGEIISKWKFLDMTENTEELDLRIIRHLFETNETFVNIKEFHIEDYIILLCSREVILYKVDQYFNIYNKTQANSREILNKVVKDISYTDGIDLDNHYDILNMQLCFGKEEIPIADMVKICDVICTTNKTVLYGAEGDAYSLECNERTCKINHTPISKNDIAILDFLFTTGCNLLELVQFEIKGVNFILADKYLIKYTEDDSDYIEMSSNLNNILDFITEDIHTLKQSINSESEQKVGVLKKLRSKFENKNIKKKKVKTIQSEVNEISKEPPKKESKVLKTLKFLVKKPD